MGKNKNGKEKYEVFWEENVTDDVEAIDVICYNASQLIAKDLLVHFNSDSNGASEYRVLAGWFSDVYFAIMSVMKGMMNRCSTLQVDICGRFFIQLSDGVTDDDTADEKLGNYVFSMIPSSNNPKKTQFSDNQDTEERCALWETENIINTPELINKIKIQAMKNLKNDLDLSLLNSSLVMPIFIYIFDCFMDYYQKAVQDGGGVDYNGNPEFNFCNCFTASANYDDEKDKWDIGFRPSIEKKLGGKDDLDATSKYE